MMMKYAKIAGLVAVLAVAVTGIASAEGKFDKVLKARQSWMQIYSFNLGNLGAMAKGKAPYDAAKASAFAENLLAAASMKNGAMWPAGSDNSVLGDKTRAKPEIWSTYPKVAEKGKALVAAAQNLVKVAGSGLDALKGGVGTAGKACGGCHKPFREKKK